MELSQSQSKEYSKLSDEVKQSYPVSAFALMESKSIAQLRTDKDAPRGYKAIALQFNRYEYSRLEDAAEKLGISKNEFMRDAINMSLCQMDEGFSMLSEYIPASMRQGRVFFQHVYFNPKSTASDISKEISNINFSDVRKHLNSHLEKIGFAIGCIKNPLEKEFRYQLINTWDERSQKSLVDQVKSNKIKAKLKSAKDKGVKLGNPNLDKVRNTDTSKATQSNMVRAKDRNSHLRSVINEIQKASNQRLTMKQIARILNDYGYKTARGLIFTDMRVKTVIRSGLD